MTADNKNYLRIRKQIINDTSINIVRAVIHALHDVGVVIIKDHKEDGGLAFYLPARLHPVPAEVDYLIQYIKTHNETAMSLLFPMPVLTRDDAESLLNSFIKEG